MKLHLALPVWAFAFLATGLSAQTMTFAQFTQVQPSKKLLVFDNDEKAHRSIAATLDTASVSAGVDVDFSFSSNLVFTGALAALNGPQKADFIMQSKTDDEASHGSHHSRRQPIDSGFMEFKLETPVDGKDLLLKVTFSEASLFVSKSTGLELAVGTPLGESKITYSSDFLDFNTLSPDSWAISLSDIDPGSSIGADGALKDFSASASGIFLGAATPIPEPASSGRIVALISFAVVLCWKLRARLLPAWKLAN